MALATLLPRSACSFAQASAPMPGGEPAFSEEARRRLLGGMPAPVADRFEADRLLLLDEARSQLAAGQGAAALETLERTALMRHAADTELAIVRAQMATGHYRRALALCAHAAGAHREQTAGAALYAWLLHLGGHEVVAQRLLADAVRRAPDDPLLRHTREALAQPWPIAGALLRQEPACAAPPAHGVDAADQAPVGVPAAGTALLLASGREALVPRAVAAASRRLWLRNGLGQTVAVHTRRALSDPSIGGLDRLELRTALPVSAWLAAPREPFAGSPGTMVEYAPDPLGHAAWPLLRQGFFAGQPGSATARPLGLAAPAGPRGGPVFDAAARLVGMAVDEPASSSAASRAQADRLVGVASLRELVGTAALPCADDTQPAPRRAGLDVAHELAYELSLRGALQVLVDGRDG